MKGAYIIAVAGTIIIFVVLLLALGLLAEEARKYETERNLGEEKYLGITIPETKAQPITSDATGSLPWAEQPARSMFDTSQPYYVSEIGCDIAKDIYDDFRTWGEQRTGLDYISGADAFKEPTSNMLCEYSPKEKKYLCLVGKGQFYLDQKNLGSVGSVPRTNLKGSGCWKNSDDTAGCSYTGGNEYKLDEVCVNEVFNQLNFSGIRFCTSNPTDYLRISMGDQRLKFGNKKDAQDEGTAHYGCYVNALNTQNPEEDWATGWKYACQDLCYANGIFFGSERCVCLGGGYPPSVTYPKVDKTTCQANPLCSWIGEDVTEKEEDRVYSWLVDNRTYFYDRNIVNDRWLDIDKFVNWPFYEPISSLTDKTQQIRQDGRRYFYNVLRWDDRHDDRSTSRYAILIPRMYEQEILGYSWSKAYLFNQLNNIFFNNYGLDSTRNTIGGKKWPEMRTVYDGIIILNEQTSRTEIINALEASNSRVNRTDCGSVGECLDYNLEAKVWEERLEYYDGSWGKVSIKNVNDINLRVYHPTEGETIPPGKYRLIIRNWFSDLWYEEAFSEENGASGYSTIYWCRNDRAKAGAKIKYNGTDECKPPYNQIVALDSGDEFGTLINERRYVDKSVILVKMKECSDSDGGSYPYSYGEAKLNGRTEVDTCVGSNLNERYCLKVGEEDIKTNNIFCNYGCGGSHNGVCYDCAETDGGDSPYTNGTSIISGDGVTVDTQSDVCSGDSVTLHEKYCDSGTGTISNRDYTCFWGCSGGKCITLDKWPDNDAWTEEVTIIDDQQIDTNDGVGFWDMWWNNPPIYVWGETHISTTNKIVGSQSILHFDYPMGSGSYMFFRFKDLMNLSSCAGVHFYHNFTTTGNTGKFTLHDLNGKSAYVTFSSTAYAWQEKLYKKNDFSVDAGFDWSKIVDALFENNNPSAHWHWIDDFYFFKLDNSCGTVSDTCDDRCYNNHEYRGGTYSGGACTYSPAPQNCRFGCEDTYECYRGNHCPSETCTGNSGTLCSVGGNTTTTNNICLIEGASAPRYACSYSNNVIACAIFTSIGCGGSEICVLGVITNCCHGQSSYTVSCHVEDACTYGSLSGCTGYVCIPGP